MKNDGKWPNKESYYLFDMVIEELVSWLSSLNFSIVSKKKAEFNLQLFRNRVSIYMERKARTKKEKMSNMIGIFYRIAREELMDDSKREDFYER